MSIKTVTLDQLGEEIAKDMDALLRGIATGVSDSIVDLAPVSTGALKASIHATVNSEDTSFNPSNQDPTGASTKADNESNIKQAKAGDVVNIVVGAPYGGAIEEGSSEEAPSGFLKVTGESLDAIMARVVRNLSRFR